MIAAANILSERLKAHSHTYHKVVDFNHTKEKIIHLDFTDNNIEHDKLDYSDTKILSAYVEDKLKTAKAKFGIGGYNEDRILYKRSNLFGELSKSPNIRKTMTTNVDHKNQSSQHSSYSPPPGEIEGASRSIHLGIDIWGAEGTKVYAPLGGLVHSFAYNNNFGDYGATLILMHQLDTVTFYTLYGHLSLDDIAHVTEFKYIVRGQVIGHFGNVAENGDWPPHLHFQIIKDMRLNKGDYPGVCSITEREKYLLNCPDADLILNMMQYVN